MEAVLGVFLTLLTIAAVAIPIVVVMMIVLRMSEMAKKLRDPGRLQQVFAESAAAALRRAGADPKAIAKLEGLGRGARTVDLRAAVAEARAALREPDAAAPISPAEQPAPAPRSAFDEALPLPSPARSRAATLHALQRPPRPRQQHAPAAPSAGLQMGERFRLSEPPEISEPRGPLSFNANWFAAAALIGAAAYYLIR